MLVIFLSILTESILIKTSYNEHYSNKLNTFAESWLEVYSILAKYYNFAVRKLEGDGIVSVYVPMGTDEWWYDLYNAGESYTSMLYGKPEHPTAIMMPGVLPPLKIIPQAYGWATNPAGPPAILQELQRLPPVRRKY